MKKLVMGIGVGILIILVLAYIFYVRPNYYLFNGGQIDFSSEIRKELIHSQYVDVLAHEDALYFCSKEGLEKRGLDGSGKWTKPYQMLSPILKNRGDYFLVIDVLGHDAFLFHKDGFLASIRENLPIISGEVTSQGNLALVLESDMENRIKIYNKDGLPLIERGSVLSQDGYPVALGLSGDGIHLATSYVDVFKGKIESKVTMFGFDSYHEDLDEFIIRADIYENELIPQVHYFEDKALWVIGSHFAHVYPMQKNKEIYGQAQAVEIMGDIDQVHYTDQGVLIYSDSKQAGDRRYRLRLYRMNGDLEVEYGFAEPLELLASQANDYFIADQEKIMKYSGSRLIWQYPFYEKIDGFYQISQNRYLLLRPMGYTVWKVEALN